MLVFFVAASNSGNVISSIVGYRTFLAEEGPSFVCPRTSECAKTHAAVISITVNTRLTMFLHVKSARAVTLERRISRLFLPQPTAVDGRLAVQQTKEDHGTVANGSYARSPRLRLVLYFVRIRSLMVSRAQPLPTR